MGGAQQNLAYRWYGRNSVCKMPWKTVLVKRGAATVLYLVVAFVVAGIVELLGKI